MEKTGGAPPAEAAPEAGLPEGMFVVEEARRLSESLIWTLQREYYKQRGTTAWTSGDLPWYVTSNAFIARAYARVVLGFLRDWVSAGPGGGFDPSRPVHILELAAGTGHFAYLFLKKLLALKQALPALAGLQLRYVLSDLPESNLEAWRAQPHFRPLVEQGLLDFALFDLEKDDRLTLVHSGAVLAPEVPGNPMVVLANYAFDSTTQDLFFVQDGVLREGRVTLCSDRPETRLDDPEILSRIGLRYEQRPAEEAYYGDPVLDGILGGYREKLGNTSLLIPIGALRCLGNLMKLAGGRLLLISADKGVTGVEEIVRRGEPHRVRHGNCFSMDVNFHALGLYAEGHGGMALYPSQRDRHLKVSAFLLGPPPGGCAETRLAYQEALESLTPYDYHRLATAIRKDYAEPPLEFILALLKLGDWDYQFLIHYGRLIARVASSASDSLKWELRRALEAVWENFYPVKVDLPFEIARVLASMQLPLEALKYYKESLRLFGPHHATLFNMGLCLYFLQQPQEALRFMDRALQIKPDYGQAREWRNRLQAELAG